MLQQFSPWNDVAHWLLQKSWKKLKFSTPLNDVQNAIT
jgi:hypothetical protein